MSANYKQLTDFTKKIEKLNNQQKEEFLEACCRELAARLLAKVIKRTPVGVYGTEKVVEKKVYDYWQEEGTDNSAGKRHRYDTGRTKHVTIRTSSKTGGTLRRGWTAGEKKSASTYANSLEIKKVGDKYHIDITNPVEYASYVEYGHRTKNHGGWVEGHYMLTISEAELNSMSDAILQKKLNKFMKDVFG